MSSTPADGASITGVTDISGPDDTGRGEDGEPVVATTVIAPAAPTPPCVKVRIDAGGREIELETSEPTATATALAATAFALWTATGAANPDGRGTFGLISSERSGDRAPSSTMDWPVDVPR